MTEFDWGEMIFSYSRKQAIEDGVLVDLTSYARLQGFKYPVACTVGVFHEIGAGVSSEAVPAMLDAMREAGRALDSKADRVIFKVGEVAMYAICGPGDTLAPVITIMLPWED